MRVKILILILISISNENYVNSEFFEPVGIKLFAGKNFTGQVITLLENTPELSFTFRSIQVQGSENWSLYTKEDYEGFSVCLDFPNFYEDISVFNIPAGIVNSAKIGCACHVDPGIPTTTTTTVRTTTPDPIDRIRYQECGAGETSLATDIKLWSPQIVNGQPPLVLKKGLIFTFFLSFRASTNAVTLYPKLLLEISGIQFPGTINPDVCGKLTQNSCPFQERETYTYSNTFMIQTSYPAAALIAIWKLQLPDGKSEVCFRVPIKIVS